MEVLTGFFIIIAHLAAGNLISVLSGDFLPGSVAESSYPFKCQFYRTMVRTIYFSVYPGINQPVAQVLADYEVIDTPPCILLSSLETV